MSPVLNDKIYMTNGHIQQLLLQMNASHEISNSEGYQRGINPNC